MLLPCWDAYLGGHTVYYPAKSYPAKSYPARPSRLAATARTLLCRDTPPLRVYPAEYGPLDTLPGTLRTYPDGYPGDHPDGNPPSSLKHMRGLPCLGPVKSRVRDTSRRRVVGLKSQCLRVAKSHKLRRYHHPPFYSFAVNSEMEGPPPRFLLRPIKYTMSDARPGYAPLPTLL